MPNIVTSNIQIKNVLNIVRTTLNTNLSSLRLFTNNFTPDPTSTFFDFVEASFPGYAFQPLNARFGVPLGIGTGYYQSQTPLFRFNCTGASAQVVYGWYITSFADVLYSSAFLNPVSLFNGQIVAIQIVLQEQAMSVACP